MKKWSVIVAFGAALFLAATTNPASSSPLLAFGGPIQEAAEGLSLVESVQRCRQIWTSVPYCTRTRYRGLVCGRRAVARTVCDQGRLRRVCYRTAYRGILCEWRRY